MRRPKSGFLEVKLKDGTRLGVTSARIDESNVEATSRFGQKVRFLLSELVSVHVRSPSYDYLTERKPVRAAYFPYVGPTREFRVDRTVDGHLFELSGQTFDRGIGTQSRTLLAYRIEPGDRRFQALVGVDERAGLAGQCCFSRAGGSKRAIQDASRFRIVTHPSRSTWMSRVGSS